MINGLKPTPRQKRKRRKIKRSLPSSFPKMCALIISANAMLFMFPKQEKTAGSRNAKPQLPSREDHPWLGLLLLDADPYIHIPGPINRYLRGYQRDGIKFFYKQWKKRCGGILGDDMGLGAGEIFPEPP